MSKVVIQGNASGTGNFTIAAPNSDTNRTLTLPDQAGEVLVNGTTSNVGIGLTNPTAPLNVSTTSGTIARFAATTNTAAFEINAPIADYIALKAMVGDGLIFSTNNNEKMRITSTGNVGIGNTAPQELLHLQKTGGATIRFQNPGQRVWSIGNDGTSFVIDDVTGAAERMRIDSSGNVLVGKTSTGYTAPGVRLAGQGYASNFAHNTANQTNVLFSAPVSQSQIAFYRQDTGAGMGSITNGATNSVAYNTSSDYRLKEDWQPMSGSVDRVKSLNPVNFAWKADGSRVDGFLAHEAQAVVPEAVTGTHNEVDDDGNPVMQGIDQSKLVPLLTAALQDSIAKIEALEARVTALENA